MRIGILTATISEAEFFPNILELKKIGEIRGHKVDIFKNGEFQLLVDGSNGSKLFLNGKEFNVLDFDIIINRLSVREKNNADYYVVEEFIRNGVKVFNTPEVIMKARNKLLSLQIMSSIKEGIQFTKSFVIRRYQDLELVDKHIQYPLILKNIYGSLGSSVLIIYDYKQLISTFDYLWNINRNEVILIQEFVKSHDNSISDFRVFILGDKIISSMERVGKKGDFRANYKKGASIKYSEVTDDEKEKCLIISKEFGLEMAGIDFIRTKNGPVFLEVNSNPGLEGIRKATLENSGLDILDEIITYCERVK